MAKKRARAIRYSDGPENSGEHTAVDSDWRRWTELATIAQQDFFNRRQLEWRLSFAFWTAIAAFTAAFFAEHGLKKPSDSHFMWWVSILYLFGFVLFAFWQGLIQRAHWKSKRFWLYYMHKAAGFEQQASESLNRDGRVKLGDSLTFDWKWFWAHCLFTALVLILSGIILCRFPAT